MSEISNSQKGFFFFAMAELFAFDMIICIIIIINFGVKKNQAISVCSCCNVSHNRN